MRQNTSLSPSLPPVQRVKYFPPQKKWGIYLCKFANLHWKIRFFKLFNFFVNNLAYAIGKKNGESYNGNLEQKIPKKVIDIIGSNDL